MSNLTAIPIVANVLFKERWQARFVGPSALPVEPVRFASIPFPRYSVERGAMSRGREDGSGIV